MARALWRPRLRRGQVFADVQSWLTEPGSLTARCQRACSSFRVRLVRFEKGRALADEALAGRRAWVREVLLECDGMPVIFAHTTLSTATNGPLSRWMARLGERSLGSLLFSFPGFRRGGIEFLRLDARHPLYRRAMVHTQDAQPILWARRSRHSYRGQSVVVTEVFLPAIRGLA